jgi:methyltransferase (TIGR00027 family)
MRESIVNSKPSRTALSVAFARALADLDPNPKLRRVDPMAVHFLPAPLRYALRAVPYGFFHRLCSLSAPGGYEFTIARAAYFDDIFARALADGCGQVVFLGAGYDTKAYRFAQRARGARVFELDSPHTQRRKLRILERVLPNHRELVCYVALNFHQQSLAEALSAAGYQSTVKTLFILEGVMPYLKPDAVDSTFAFIASSAPGSSAVFDYLYASVLRNECDYYGARTSYKGAWQHNEHWVFGIEEGQLEDFVRQRGFRILSHCTPRQLEALYWERVTNGRERVIGCLGIAHCAVESRS